MSPSGPEPAPPVGRVLLACALAGAAGGAATGAIDGLWSWSGLPQFLPKFGGKLNLLVFLAACYGFAGAIAAPAIGAVGMFYMRVTRLGDIVRAATAAHADTRDDDPRDALVGLSLVIVGIPIVAGLVGVAYLWAADALVARKHFGLVIATAMGTVVVALGAGVMLTFALARPVELGLQAIARTDKIARALSSKWAVAAAAGLLVVIAVAITWAKAGETLELLNLRWAYAGIAAVVFTVASMRWALFAAARVLRARPALRWSWTAGYPILALLVVVTGSDAGARKAATQYTGLGGPLMRAYRGAFDFDRDGYSRILGGGDCDDSDAAVHPGAVEIPDDGVDQNCVGGDPSLDRPLDDIAFTAVPASVPEDFNVILLTIDTVRADHFGAYGYERNTSPNIDALAADGALFVNSWAHAPSTRYSIPAILTGRYPLNVDYDTSIKGWPGLSRANTTIAEVMKAAGMKTAAYLNYWYFQKQRHMDQGFDIYDNSNQSLHGGVKGAGPERTRGSSSKQQTDKALGFLDKHGTERFFMWVHYYDPHYEYELHEEVENFGDRKIDLFDNEIAFTDLHIGRLIDDLKERGIYDKTAIIVTGDHGEGFGEHGIELHGYHLYAAQTKVPLIIRVPGVDGRRVELPAGHIDLLPTLANLAGEKPAKDMMGRSLLGAMTGEDPGDGSRYVFQQLSYENNNEMRGAANAACHVIYNVSPNLSWELYRLGPDPEEKRDAIDDPRECSQARGALERWYDLSELPAGAAEARLPGRPELTAPIDVLFGDHVRLIEVALPAEPVKIGAAFDVTLTFEAHGGLPDGWGVFAHFEGARGQRFTADHKPPYPFAWWKDGQFIRYTRSVTVPKGRRAGTYALWLGLWRKNERQPVTVQGDIEAVDNRVHVGDVQVVK